MPSPLQNRQVKELDAILTMCGWACNAGHLVRVQWIDKVIVVRTVTRVLAAVCRPRQTHMWTLALLTNVRRCTQYNRLDRLSFLSFQGR